MSEEGKEVSINPNCIVFFFLEVRDLEDKFCDGEIGWGGGQRKSLYPPGCAVFVVIKGGFDCLPSGNIG
jgi:hypothetical protein